MGEHIYVSSVGLVCMNLVTGSWHKLSVLRESWKAHGYAQENCKNIDSAM